MFLWGCRSVSASELRCFDYTDLWREIYGGMSFVRHHYFYFCRRLCPINGVQKESVVRMRSISFRDFVSTLLLFVFCLASVAAPLVLWFQYICRHSGGFSASRDIITSRMTNKRNQFRLFAIRHRAEEFRFDHFTWKQVNLYLCNLVASALRLNARVCD